MRNPIKFLHPFQILWIILAGYGLEVLHRRYLQNTAKRADFLPSHFKSWWSRAAGFEKKWVAACALLVAACLAGWVILFSSQARLAGYLADQGFKMAMAPGCPSPALMAQSCVVEAAWFLGFLVLSAGALAAILSGAWSGPRAKTAWIFLGAILILDLGRADLPWVHYFDYETKYSPNVVTDFLTQLKPFEQRVMGRLAVRRAGSTNGSRLGPAV